MADIDTRHFYKQVWAQIRHLEWRGADMTEEQDEAERAYGARDYSTLVDLYDDLGRRLSRRDK